jgi:hypothetical protein
MQERCIDTVFQPSHFAVSLLENQPHTRTSPSIAWTRRIVHLFWQFLLEAVRFQDSPKNAPSSQVGAASAMEYICMQECKEMWTLTHIQALSPFLIASISRPVKNQTPVPVSPARITWVHPYIVCFHCSPGPASRIHSCNEPDRTRASGSTNCTSQVAGIRGISPIPPWRICAGICSQMGPATAMESVTPKKAFPTVSRKNF